jgi:hypothetical protein
MSRLDISKNGQFGIMTATCGPMKAKIITCLYDRAGRVVEAGYAGGKFKKR